MNNISHYQCEECDAKIKSNTWCPKHPYSVLIPIEEESTMTEISTMSDLVGKKIQRTLINKNKTIMYWLVNDAWYSLNAIGDCCSYSWYEHCDNADALDNATILEYEYTYEDSQQTGFDNEIKINMMKFKTDKGYCTIEFRNESNGYYSGWTEIRSEGNIEESDSVSVMKDF